MSRSWHIRLGYARKKVIANFGKARIIKKRKNLQIGFFSSNVLWEDRNVWSSTPQSITLKVWWITFIHICKRTNQDGFLGRLCYLLIGAFCTYYFSWFIIIYLYHRVVFSHSNFKFLLILIGKASGRKDGILKAKRADNDKNLLETRLDMPATLS